MFFYFGEGIVIYILFIGCLEQYLRQNEKYLVFEYYNTYK
jgi:hypothetical protein